MTLPPPVPSGNWFWAKGSPLGGLRTWLNQLRLHVLALQVDGGTGTIDATDPVVATLVADDASSTRSVLNPIVDGRATATVGPALALEVAAGTALGAVTHATVQAAATAAAASGRRLYAAGTYTTNQTLTITSDADLSGLTIRYTGTSVAVQVGAGPVLFRKEIKLPHVIDASKPGTGWRAGTTGVRVVNANACHLTVPLVRGFETGLHDYGQAQGCVHNTYMLGHLDNNKRNHVLGADATGWANSNVYIGGKFSHNSAEGTAVPGTRHILLTSAPNAVNGNTWLNPSVESVEAEFMIDVDKGDYNLFLNPRLESVGGGRVRWGAGATNNQIVGGYAPQFANVTRVAGQTRNTLQSNNIFELYGTSNDGILRLQNRQSSSAPSVAMFDPDVFAPASWAWRWSADSLAGKRTAEAHPRIVLDRANGRVQFGTGTAAPAWHLGPLGTAGLALNGGNLYAQPDNTHDLGLADNLRFRDINAGRYVRVGTIILRDNGGTLEKSTNGTTWTVV